MAVCLSLCPLIPLSRLCRSVELGLMISEAEAARRLAEAIARVDARLVLDRAAVRAMTEPYAGVEYGLRLGAAGALLFMPEADLSAADWERRVFTQVKAAKRYLEGFPRV